jgi:hypothetical protein
VTAPRSETDRRLARTCARFERALRSGLTTPRNDGDLRRQAARYSRAAERAATVQAQVRQTLCGLGVVPARFGQYLCFARELDRLTRTCSGRRLDLEAVLLRGRWRDHGLSLAVMKAICEQVFNVSTSLGPDPDLAGGRG